MEIQSDAVISAQVLLMSASGRKIGPEALITSENLTEYAPAADTITQASQILAKLGFEVGELVGISVSITAPASTFDKVFGLRLVQTQEGGIKSVGKDGSLSEEIPATAWPKSLSGLVAAITFVPPPEFGPTKYF